MISNYPFSNTYYTISLVEKKNLDAMLEMRFEDMNLVTVDIKMAVKNSVSLWLKRAQIRLGIVGNPIRVL